MIRKERSDTRGPGLDLHDGSIILQEDADAQAHLTRKGAFLTGRNDTGKTSPVADRQALQTVILQVLMTINDLRLIIK